MELMGLNEIAAIAGVSAQAVSNWRVRSNLPEPLVTLASGPIWDGRVIRAWLRAAGKSSTTSTQEIRMHTFIKDHEYTHAQVVAALGGETVSYLPQSNGTIVGGRFKQDEFNPDAPRKIIVGNVPRVLKKAELLAVQKGPIPVFLKKGTNRWSFYGNMRCTGFHTDRRTIDGTRGAQRRKESGDVAGILFLEDAQ